MSVAGTTPRTPNLGVEAAEGADHVAAIDHGYRVHGMAYPAERRPEQSLASPAMLSDAFDSWMEDACIQGIGRRRILTSRP